MDMVEVIRLILQATEAELASLDKDSREEDFSEPGCMSALMAVEASVEARRDVFRAYLIEHGYDTEG